jgi:hypothetical protein
VSSFVIDADAVNNMDQFKRLSSDLLKEDEVFLPTFNEKLDSTLGNFCMRQMGLIHHNYDNLLVGARRNIEFICK